MSPAVRPKNDIEGRDVLLFAENSRDGIFIRSEKGFAFVNPAMGRIYNCDPEEFYKNPGILFDRVHPEDKKKVKDLFYANNSFSDKFFCIEFRLQIPDGFSRWVWYRQFPLLTPAGNFFHTAGILSDITNLKETEIKLSLSENSLKEQNDAKDKYFSIIAHDLRNPVNAILGFTGYILRNYESFDSYELKQVLFDLHKMTESGVSLLDNLLNWSKTQMLNHHAHPEEISLDYIIDQSIEASQPLLMGKNINLVKQPLQGCILFTDANMVTLILRNLLSNAIKYSHRGGLVELKSSIKDERVIISVSDNGVGMDTRQMEKLFSLGSNHSLPGTEKEQGAGLGLVLCKDFIEKLGGHIWVQSWPGLGTKFSFSLPLK